MPRKMKVEYSIEEPIALEDLRWLVDKCNDLPGNSIVTVREHKSLAPNDWETEKITVHGNTTKPE